MSSRCCQAASALDKFPTLKQLRPEFESHFIDLDGGRIRYVETGNPDADITVVLMPDPPNTIEHMAALINILKNDFRILAYEGPGFGYSRASLGYDFSLQQNSVILEQLLEKLKVDRAILALTCVAALAGVLFARRKPERVAGLVLGQTPSIVEAKRWATRVDFKGLMGMPFIGQIFLRLLRTPIAKLWYQNALPKGDPSVFYFDKARDSFSRGARFSLASGFQALKYDRTRPEQLTVEQPAIVLWGMRDRTHQRTDKASILEIIPNASLRELASCGHFPDVEQPVEYAKAVFDLAGSV